MEHCDHSYYLTQSFFDELAERLPFVLKVDCFASRLNHKLPKYISHYCDPMSSWVDAFSVTWTDNVYLFPPFPLVSRVLAKFVSDDTDHGLLVCPYWPSQPWFPTLLDLLIAPPLLLPPASVVDQTRRLPSCCQLVGWIIGLNRAKRTKYLGRFGCVGSGVSIGRLSYHTKDVGQGSAIGITNGHVVTVELL